MAKQYKESVMIGLDKNGKPICKWATGYTKRDLHISIARILAEAGLIGDAQPTEQLRKRVPNVKDFIRKVYYRSAFKHLGIVGFCAYDFRTTFATQLKESGMATSAIADLMGHADTRMVETVYARTRKEGVMKHLDALEARNA